MSILHLNNRPWVEFDPRNLDHRRWHNEVIRTGTLGACPVRFIVPTGVGSTLDRCNNSILRYYLSQEFPTKN